ncbi:MAG: hypothetical protein WD077_02425 [Bacteroidia bacterium]
MKISVIKQLAETHEVATLKKLEDDLVEGRSMEYEVGGEDEGEQLTHILGAIWVKEQMKINGSDMRTEIRNFSGRVRGSIS